MAFPAFASRLEAEVGAGASGGSPALTSRLGVDFVDHFTLSLRVLGVGNENDSGLSGAFDALNTGFNAWAAMAEVRAHTSGTFQLSLAGGLGLGHMPNGASCNITQGASACSELSPYEQAGVGARILFGGFFVSADASAQLWNGAQGQTLTGNTWTVPSHLGGMILFGVGGRTSIL